MYGRSSAVASAGAKLRIKVSLGTKEDVFLVSYEIGHQSIDFPIELVSRIVELVITLWCREYCDTNGSLKNNLSL